MVDRWWRHLLNAGGRAAVIPAKAEIHSANLREYAVHGLDSRFRGNDYAQIDTTTGTLVVS
jgi:hypothetical protein